MGDPWGQGEEWNSILPEESRLRKRAEGNYKPLTSRFPHLVGDVESDQDSDTDKKENESTIAQVGDTYQAGNNQKRPRPKPTPYTQYEKGTIVYLRDKLAWRGKDWKCQVTKDLGKDIQVQSTDDGQDYIEPKTTVTRIGKVLSPKQPRVCQ